MYHPTPAVAKYEGGRQSNRANYEGVFVSPLATLAFKLCVVGDTGLKPGG